LQDSAPVVCPVTTLLRLATAVPLRPCSRRDGMAYRCGRLRRQQLGSGDRTARENRATVVASEPPCLLIVDEGALVRPIDVNCIMWDGGVAPR
jgi:hypothetical protein